MVEETPIKSEDVQIGETLPVVPLNNAVLLPGTTAPLAVSSEESIKSIETAVKANRLFAAIAVKAETKPDESTYEHLYRIGTVAQIVRMMRGNDQVTQLVVRGLQKIRISRIEKKEGIPWASVETLEEKRQVSNAIEALMRQIIEKSEILIQKSPLLPRELQGMPSSIENPHRLAYFVMNLMRTGMHRLQEIYETPSLEKKLRLTLQELSRELELVDLGGKIQNEVQSHINRNEREYFLREQLRAIQKELGESEEENPEIHELRAQLEKKALPDEIRAKIGTELKRLERISPMSPEYPMARNYVDWLVEFPWLDETEDKINIAKAEKILHEDHHDLKQVKERILEYLAVRKLNPSIKGPILCFIGPPGVGKTSLGQSIARALGRKFVRISLGGVHDEAEIRGHRRTYIGALPGTIVQQIRRAGTINPVFMLDEIDKIGQDFRGDPSSALLEVLDPQQNHTFRDHYMEANIDLSKVLFIATANAPDPIQPALRDRMEEIRLAGYTTYEKIVIAERYLIPRAVKENGLEPKDVVFGKGALEFLIRGYTREAGVRNLEREIMALCRKIAVQKTRGRWKPRKLVSALIREFLGAERFEAEIVQRTSRAGVSTGLAWTQVGGEILFVEALPVVGGKGVILTGKLGEVMKESARAAYSLVRSRSKKLNIPKDFFDQHEIHLHVPAGAVAKDGPSAGITMATAIASAAMKIPVRKDVAMTGEITLSGLVLPIGGVKEKVLAAHRAGIYNVIMPNRNEKDLEEVDSKIRKEMKFIFVDSIDEVLDTALKNTKEKSTRKSNKK